LISFVEIQGVQESRFTHFIDLEEKIWRKIIGSRLRETSNPENISPVSQQAISNRFYLAVKKGQGT
jgi:hypothetical protein